MSRTTLLIDGDLILFRACAAVEKEVRWDENTHVLSSDWEDAQDAAASAVSSLFERFGTERHIIALSQGPTFRHKLTSTYKSNRAGQRKPLCYSRAVEWCEENYKVVKFPGLEADDVLGIFASRAPDETILCSMDKDMKTVPCTLWNGKELRRISEAEADYWFLYQTLIGDTTDGYPGCKGIGPKKAEALLTVSDGDLYAKTPLMAWAWPVVVQAFEKAGFAADFALLQARLARILRASDWDATKKEPILWTPPS